MICTATFIYRGVVLECTRAHESCAYSDPTHSSNGVYWRDGETARDRCTATATYCGEHLQCDFDQPCKNFHATYSVRYGGIKWSDEKRPQPAVMFDGLGFGHRYGSFESDALMLSAATNQDAANRMEYLARARGEIE